MSKYCFPYSQSEEFIPPIPPQVRLREVLLLCQPDGGGAKSPWSRRVYSCIHRGTVPQTRIDCGRQGPAYIPEKNEAGCVRLRGWG